MNTGKNANKKRRKKTMMFSGGRNKNCLNIVSGNKFNYRVMKSLHR